LFILYEIAHIKFCASYSKVSYDISKKPFSIYRWDIIANIIISDAHSVGKEVDQTDSEWMDNKKDW